MASRESKVFSWLNSRKKEKSRKDEVEEKPQTSAASLATERGAEPDLSKASIPTKTEYAIEATKQTLDILSNVANMVGIPLAEQVIRIGIALLTTCETMNDVKGRVTELKRQVTSLLLVIAKIAKDPTYAPLFKSSSGLNTELQELINSLRSITGDLESIKKQNSFLTTLLPESNMKKVDDCISSFQHAISRFQILRGIYGAQDLYQVQTQLQEAYGLTQVVAGKVDKMQNSIDGLRAMLDRPGSEHFGFDLSAEMPPSPDLFLGRSSSVERITRCITSGDTKQSRVCVLGPGGIGKTSVALAAIENPAVSAKFLPKNIIWVPCLSLTSPNAFLVYLARRLANPNQAYPLQALISTLQNDSNAYVIILDNFETTWHPIEGDQSLTKKILRSLDTLPNVSIIVTMRSEFPPLAHWMTERLDILAPEDSRLLYTTIEPRSQDSKDLDQLLQALGHLPFAVTLVATQARYAGASPSKMLLEWKAVGSEMLSDVEDSSRNMDNSISLSVNSKYVTSSPGAVELLHVLSMLPAGTYQDDISIWTTSWRVSALSTLRNAALVVTREIEMDGESKTHLLVLPVIQAYIQQRSRIPEKARHSIYDSCLTFLYTHRSVIGGPNEPGYKVDLPVIATQEANLEVILTELLLLLLSDETLSNALTHSEAERFDGLLTFISYQRYNRPRLDLAEHVIELAQRKHSKVHEAGAIYCLASMQNGLEQSSAAAANFDKARDLFSSLGEHDKACSADFMAILCKRESHPSQMPSNAILRLMEAALSRWHPHFSDPVISGLATYWTAYFGWLVSPRSESDINRILKDLIHARDNLRLAKRAWDLLQCYDLHVGICLQTGRLEEATLAIDEAMALDEMQGRPMYGTFYLYKAQAMKMSDLWDLGLLSTLQMALELSRKAGLPYDTAIALDEMTEYYVHEQEWQAARLTCEETLKECRKGSGFSINLIRDRGQDNLRFIRTMEMDGDVGSLKYYPPTRR